jgi:hypothetical protein
LTVAAAFFATSMPADSEPVIEIMSMPGWLDNAAPTTEPLPWIMLNTPAGRRAASKISASMQAEKCASCDGFNTTVQPVASAGNTLTVT